MSSKLLIFIILIFVFITKCTLCTNVGVQKQCKYSANGYFFAHGYFKLGSGVYPVAKLIKQDDTNLPAFFVFSDYITTQKNIYACISQLNLGIDLISGDNKNYIRIPIRSIHECLYKIPFIKQKNVFILKQNGELQRTDYMLTRKKYRRLVTEVYNCDNVENPTNTIYKILNSQ